MTSSRMLVSIAVGAVTALFFIVSEWPRLPSMIERSIPPVSHWPSEAILRDPSQSNALNLHRLASDASALSTAVATATARTIMTPESILSTTAFCHRGQVHLRVVSSEPLSSTILADVWLQILVANGHAQGQSFTVVRAPSFPLERSNWSGPEIIRKAISGVLLRGLFAGVVAGGAVLLIGMLLDRMTRKAP